MAVVPEGFEILFPGLNPFGSREAPPGQVKADIFRIPHQCGFRLVQRTGYTDTVAEGILEKSPFFMDIPVHF
ncbi:hypothetical protein SDC9_84153 [bioreactor metagenome]|uniref:Uncharacterized protein n=1 Tax=bioreactor metagenome TaxID=1076179 RepID=A0A644Z9H1_9ZZZZ